MDLGLKDKVVVVTGGGSGIGLATALEFAREGAKVAICGRNSQKLEEAKAVFAQEGLTVFAGICDVTVSRAVADFVAEVTATVGPIHVWVNNAGSNQVYLGALCIRARTDKQIK